MDNLFPSAQSKIQRANKHIRDLNSMLSEFGDSEFYELTVEFDPIRKTNHLRFDIDASGFTTDAALITGDVLHNLRSALDILYYEVVAEGTGTRWTRFPICDKRGDLIRRLDAALSSHQVSIGMHDFIIDTIKPYQDGNYALWALHDLNILDKHKLLIPAMQVVRFEGVRLEDELRRNGRKERIHYG